MALLNRAVSESREAPKIFDRVILVGTPVALDPTPALAAGGRQAFKK